MSLTPDYQRDWPAYFDAVADQPPRDTLLRALDATANDHAGRMAELFAIDLACGEGRDTREILRRSQPWRVFAVDNSDDALARLGASLPQESRARVRTACCPLEEVPARADMLPGTADLINASFALPFCHEDHFPALWAWIVRTLRPGGRFAGQLFGDRDEWAAVNPRRHFSRGQVLALLGWFDVEHFDEAEKTGSDALMATKRHHLFHIVAVKPTGGGHPAGRGLRPA